NKIILKQLDLNFQRGKLNCLQAPNGFGKTTIVNMLFGLYQPLKGEIVINERYRLNELNLKNWRGKISYSESRNLIKSNLSMGQTQLLDLQETFKTEKEIYIFDEADNHLDQDNEKNFQKEIKVLSQKKIVIIMSALKYVY